jgi:hypothetical protein
MIAVEVWTLARSAQCSVVIAWMGELHTGRFVVLA